MRIGIDFDGTIADTNRAKALWIQRHLGIKIPHYLCDRTSAVPLIGETTYRSMSNDMYSEHGTLSLLPIPGFRQALCRITKHHEVIIVTARQGERLSYAQAWFTLHHFPRSLEVCGVPTRQIGKIAVCKSAAIQMLIDDDSRHLPSREDKDVKGILFKHCAPSSYKSNDQTICRTWSEVVNLLKQPETTYGYR